MLRPCYLVIDREFSSSISTRKLVIETAKFNVITAYSGVEALATLEAFPSVNGAVLDEQIGDIPCAELVTRMKRIKPGLPIIVIGMNGLCGDADHHVDSFMPEKLLELLRKLQPAQTAAIEKTNEALSSAEAGNSSR